MSSETCGKSQYRRECPEANLLQSGQFPHARKSTACGQRSAWARSKRRAAPSPRGTTKSSTGGKCPDPAACLRPSKVPGAVQARLPVPCGAVEVGSFIVSAIPRDPRPSSCDGIRNRPEEARAGRESPLPCKPRRLVLPTRECATIGHKWKNSRQGARGSPLCLFQAEVSPPRRALQQLKPPIVRPSR